MEDTASTLNEQITRRVHLFGRALEMTLRFKEGKAPYVGDEGILTFLDDREEIFNSVRAINQALPDFDVELLGEPERELLLEEERVVQALMQESATLMDQVRNQLELFKQELARLRGAKRGIAGYGVGNLPGNKMNRGQI